MKMAVPIQLYDVIYSHMRHDVFIYETRCILIWDMMYSYMSIHDVFTHETRLTHSCDTTHFTGGCRCTLLIHICDMTHSYVWHDSFYRWHDVRIERVIHMNTYMYTYIHIYLCIYMYLYMMRYHSFKTCDTIHDIFINETWLFHNLWHDIICDTTHSACRSTCCFLSTCTHDSYICVTRLIYTCDVTYSAGGSTCTFWSTSERWKIKQS